MKSDKKYLFQIIIFPIIIISTFILSYNYYEKNQKLKKYNLNVLTKLINDYKTMHKNINKTTYNISQNKEIKFKKIQFNYFRIYSTSDDIAEIFNVGFHKLDISYFHDYNENIEYILSKDNLNKKDKKYLKTFYEYTKEIINIYNQLENDFPTKNSYSKINNENILIIYPILVEQVNRLNKNAKYKILDTYEKHKTLEKEISDFKAKEILRLLDSRVFINGKTLKAKNRNKNSLEFETIEPDYNYKIDKNKNLIDISFNRLTHKKRILYNEIKKQINDFENNLNLKNYQLFKKEIEFNKDKEFDKASLGWIKKEKTIFNETTKIYLDLTRSGQIYNLRINIPKKINYSNLNIDLPNKDIINTKILDSYIVFNNHKELEYHLFTKLNNINYTVIYNLESKKITDVFPTENTKFNNNFKL